MGHLPSDQGEPSPTPEKSMGSNTKGKRSHKGKGKRHVDAFRKLKALPNFQLIHTKLCAGVSCESVATYLQKQCDLYTDVREDSLVRQLYLYRKTIPITERHPTTVTSLEEELQHETHKVEELRETNLLYELTKMRITKLVLVEKGNQIGLHPQLNALVDQASRLLLQIRGMKRDLGKVPGAPDYNPDGASETELDMLKNGAMSVILKQYGPRAHEVLTRVGRLMQEKLRQLPPPPSPDQKEIEIAEYSIIEDPKPVSNGNGSH